MLVLGLGEDGALLCNSRLPRVVLIAQSLELGAGDPSELPERTGGAPRALGEDLLVLLLPALDLLRRLLLDVDRVFAGFHGRQAIGRRRQLDRVDVYYLARGL